MGVTPDFSSELHPWLQAAFEEVLPDAEWEIMPDTGPVAAPEVLDRYDGVLVLGLHFPAASFQGVQRLAVLARWGVGYDRIDVAACTAADVLLAITPGAVRRPVAEGILALIFAVAKNLLVLDRRCRGGVWRDSLPRGLNLEGKTLGSVGAGNIARELFRLARGVGFRRILAFDPYVQEHPPRVEGSDLDTLLRESDFVTVNCPLNEETRGLLGAAQLERMKPTAFLINTARGPVVDEEALVEALRSGKIAGAGLDVFETEPLPPDSPLLELENVIVTPHAIAWTQELCRDNSREACRNLRSVSQGQAPPHLANPEVLTRPGCQARLARWRAK